MESTIIYATLIYLMSFRLFIIVLGGMSIYLGYRLFSNAMGKQRKSGDNAAEMEAKFGDNQLTLKNAAPGTFFAAFGAVIVIVVLASSPPEFTFQTSGVHVSAGNGKIKVADKAPSQPKPPETNTPTPASTTMTLRADEETPETAEAALRMADEALARALELTEQAHAFDNTNAEALDRLAGLNFVRGKFESALQYQEQALAFMPNQPDYEKRLAAYRQATAEE